MCGVSGVVASNSTIETNAFLRAFRTLEHRGPDDQGIFALNDNLSGKLYHTDKSTGGFANSAPIESVRSARGFLGHHRLSILDLTDNGHQPFFYNGLVMVFNGEVYNYRELRSSLLDLGYKFKTKTDTEVVLAAYHYYGTDCFKLFNGMWALAIYDPRRKILILSRDRFGIKPLYAAFHKDKIFFASEIKYFYTFGFHSVCEEMARDYILHSVIDHGEQSIVDGVQSIKPGSAVIWNLSDNTSRSEVFWSYSPKTLYKKRNLSFEEVQKKTKELIFSSVRFRLRSDVGVGVLLSGGIDSTGILASMLKFTEESDSVHSYSAVCRDRRYSEHVDIKKSLEQWGARVRPAFIEYGYDEFETTIRDLLWQQDVPFRSIAVLSQYLIYKQIKADTSHVKVLLNGQGADEIFGGYTNHQYASMASKLLRLALLPLTQESTRVHRWRADSYWKILKNILAQIKQHYFGKWGAPSPVKGNSPLASLLAKNVMWSSLPEYLRYEDRNSMAHSRESRLPFLDHNLVEFIMSLPDEYKVNLGVTKWLLRESLKELLPEHIYSSRIKRGFITPQEEWSLSGPFKRWLDSRQNDPDCLDKKETDLIRKKKVSQVFLQWRIALYNEWTNTLTEDFRP